MKFSLLTVLLGLAITGANAQTVLYRQWVANKECSLDTAAQMLNKLIDGEELFRGEPKVTVEEIRGMVLLDIYEAIARRRAESQQFARYDRKGAKSVGRVEALDMVQNGRFPKNAAVYISLVRRGDILLLDDKGKVGNRTRELEIGIQFSTHLISGWKLPYEIEQIIRPAYIRRKLWLQK